MKNSNDYKVGDKVKVKGSNKIGTVTAVGDVIVTVDFGGGQIVDIAPFGLIPA